MGLNEEKGEIENDDYRKMELKRGYEVKQSGKRRERRREEGMIRRRKVRETGEEIYKE